MITYYVVMYGGFVILDTARNNRLIKEVEFLLEVGMTQASIVRVSNISASNINKFLKGERVFSDRVLDRLENGINGIYKEIKDRKGW